MEQGNPDLVLLRQWAASYKPNRGRMEQKAKATGKAGRIRPLAPVMY
ncbi:hypothetical protein [Spirosoma sp.]|nr:hypothetical protein [Spirosoma sp.]MCX6213717.1 hypothetical protein [Spirosoma sp.]